MSQIVFSKKNVENIELEKKLFFVNKDVYPEYSREISGHFAEPVRSFDFSFKKIHPNWKLKYELHVIFFKNPMKEN